MPGYSRCDPHSPSETQTIISPQKSIDPDASVTNGSFTDIILYEKEHDRERRPGSANGASYAACSYRLAPPTARQRTAGCPRSSTCSHLPHSEQPTNTHLIVMSSFAIRCRTAYSSERPDMHATRRCVPPCSCSQALGTVYADTAVGRAIIIIII